MTKETPKVEEPEPEPTTAMVPVAPPSPPTPPTPSAMQVASERVKAQMANMMRPPEKKSDAEVVLEMMDKILSNDNIEQKSRQIFENIRGITQAYTMIEALIEGSAFVQIPDCDGFQFIEPSQVRFLPELESLLGKEYINADHGLMSSLKVMCDQMTVRLVSLNGLGREELIKLASAFNFTLSQHEHERGLADRLIGANQGRGRFP